jgi:Ser/Thr protein kinase RdoA (MazF antagonist)
MQPHSSKTVIQKIMTSTPPEFSAADAIAIAASHYGIRARAHPLVSERDQNFRLDADDGTRYTLKISNAEEDPQVVDFQNRALIHVEKQDVSLPLPRVIPSRNGQLYCNVHQGNKAHLVRVLSWLDGSVLHETKVSAGLANRLGQMLARLGLALQGFDHPGSNPPLLWDMKRAADLRPLLVHIEEAGIRQLIEQTLEHFVSSVKPSLDSLRTQVIHNDMNPSNVLMDGAQADRISGIIDFGDMIKSPLIIDLAVASSYQLSAGNDPLSGALPMITGFHAVRPLQDIEMELLIDLIRMRLVTSLLVSSYRVTLFPENREYIMISHNSARNFLINLGRLKADEALRRIRTACAVTD